MITSARLLSRIKPTAWKPSFLSTSLIILCGLAFFCFFQFLYPYHFYYQEQNQLFLNSGEYILHYFSQPAWLSCLLGDWLTQFYYYRFAGPAILSLALVLIGLTARFDLKKAGMRRGNGIAAIVLMLIFAMFSLHYSYRLSAVLSAAGGLLLFAGGAPLLTNGVSPSTNKLLRYATMLLLMAIAFWAFGLGWILFALLIIISGICHKQKTDTTAAIACTILTLIVIPTTKRLYWLDASELYTYPDTGKFVKPETGLEGEFGVETEYRLGNWDNVVNMVEGTDNPTLGQLFFYNLVQAKRGRLPYVLLKYPNNYLGTFEKIGPKSPLLTIKRMNELYWALGDMTFTERAAMQAEVFSPDNRNVGMIKRLAEVNIVSGDMKAADKYLRLLDKTFVYKKWSGQAAHNPAYAQKAAMSNKKDTLRTTDNTHLIMMELLDSNPENYVALDYLLCSDLLKKDITNFKRDYDRYCMSNGEGRITPLYQQALMIWLAGTNAKPEEWQRYIKMDDQMRRFMQYNQMRGNASFRDTYWYWFDNV